MVTGNENAGSTAQFQTPLFSPQTAKINGYIRAFPIHNDHKNSSKNRSCKTDRRFFCNLF
jgi:hypothetical protein